MLNFLRGSSEAESVPTEANRPSGIRLHRGDALDIGRDAHALSSLARFLLPLDSLALSGIHQLSLDRRSRVPLLPLSPATYLLHDYLLRHIHIHTLLFLFRSFFSFFSKLCEILASEPSAMNRLSPPRNLCRAISRHILLSTEPYAELFRPDKSVVQQRLDLFKLFDIAIRDIGAGMPVLGGLAAEG